MYAVYSLEYKLAIDLYSYYSLPDNGARLVMEQPADALARTARGTVSSVSRGARATYPHNLPFYLPPKHSRPPKPRHHPRTTQTCCELEACLKVANLFTFSFSIELVS